MLSQLLVLFGFFSLVLVSVYWINRALAEFPASTVIPSFYILFTLQAICVGALVFRDFTGTVAERNSIFFGGIIISVIGVAIINGGGRPPSSVCDGPASPSRALLPSSTPVAAASVCDGQCRASAARRGAGIVTETDGAADEYGLVAIEDDTAPLLGGRREESAA